MLTDGKVRFDVFWTCATDHWLVEGISDLNSLNKTSVINLWIRRCFALIIYQGKPVPKPQDCIRAFAILY